MPRSNAAPEWELYCYNQRDPNQSRFSSGLVRVRGRTVKVLPTWVDNFSRCKLFVSVQGDFTPVRVALHVRY